MWSLSIHSCADSLYFLHYLPCCKCSILLLYCGLDFSFSTLNSQNVLMHVSFSAFLTVCIKFNPSLSNLFFTMGTFSLSFKSHLSFGVHLWPPFQNLTGPHMYMVLSSQMLVDSVLVQLVLVGKVLLDCFFWYWLSWWVCLPYCSYFCHSCLNCHLHDD